MSYDEVFSQAYSGRRMPQVASTADHPLPGADRPWDVGSLSAHRAAAGGLHLHLCGKRRSDPPGMGAVGRAYLHREPVIILDQVREVVDAATEGL